MSYSLTVFTSIFDNKTDKRFDYDSWENFEAVLYSLSKKPGYKAKRGEKPTKKTSPLISPAIYKPDTTRANNNVHAWAGWAALDVDTYEGKFEDVIKQYEKYYFVCYSTASSTEEHPKFRLVFPLTGHVSADKIKHFWFALNKEFNSIADQQTKDLSRMYYVPAQYPNAHNFIFTHKGDFLNPDELMARHPYIEKSNGFLDSLPDNVRAEILEHRKSQASNTAIHWSSYQDCPFVNKKLVSEYRSIARIDGTGRYRMVYKIMYSIAASAVRMRYPITSGQIAALLRELDRETSNRYQKRDMAAEAERAIDHAYRTVSA
jgi:hypothetical protein